MLEDVSVYYGNVGLQGPDDAGARGLDRHRLGSNGAGKSTTLRTISGLMHAKSGSITFDGKDLSRAQGHEVVGEGIAHSPEGRRIFPRMTVDENLDLGAFSRSDKEGIAADREHVLELFPRLAERINQKAGTMSGGEQQMVAMASAMMSKPKLLMIDEPSMGLRPCWSTGASRRSSR